MDNETILVLSEWGFESLTDTFKEECIDHEALLALNPNSKELEQLIPKIGTRSKFKKALETYQMIMSGKFEVLSPSTSESNSDVFLSDALNNAENTLHESRIIPTEDPRLMQRQITGLQNFETATTTNNQSVQDNENLPDKLNNNSLEKEVQDNSKNPHTSQESPSFSSDGVKFLDLKAVLSSTIIGKVVLTTYEVHGQFNDATRRKLVDVIITTLLTKVDEFGQPITLKNQHFDQLANKIVKLFPDEEKEIYYLKPLTEGPRQKISKGKLVDLYRNRLRQMRKIGLVSNRKRKIAATEDVSDDIDEESERACIVHHEWLQHNTVPWSSVIEHWNASRPMRLKTLQHAAGNVEAFFNKWPVLKQPSGYTLIESDYNENFKDGLSLYSDWPRVSEKLEKLIRSDVKDKNYLSLLDDLKTNESTSDSRDATLLSLLPVLCISSSPIRVRKGLWKPTIAESINGFILHVKIPGDLETARKGLRERKAQMKLELQPYVIVVGPRLSAIEKSYISIDNTLYLMESPLQAVDICYKSFHVLHAKYPAESEQVWLLLQKFVYKRTTQWDKSIKSVILLTKKLEKD